MNSFENTFNFCVSVGLLNEKHKCLRCCRNYPLIVATIRQRQWYCALAINRAQKTTTPYVMALFFDSSKLPLERENSLAAGAPPDLDVELTALPRL